MSLGPDRGINIGVDVDVQTAPPRVQAKHLKRLHLALMLVWAVLFVPGLLSWEQSVPFLVFCSIYANFVGHFSSWQGARSEDSIS